MYHKSIHSHTSTILLAVSTFRSVSVSARARSDARFCIAMIKRDSLRRGEYQN